MKLTEQQQGIVSWNEDMKINAVAGSGKTSTLVEYARLRPDKRMLYLVFNKSVKVEAQNKFAKCNIHNVTVETAHSLAYKEIVLPQQLVCKAGGYKLQEVVDILKIQDFKKGLDNFMVANHVLKFLTYFCNSPALKIKDVNYLATLSSKRAMEFVTEHYDKIEHYTRKLMAKMHAGSVEITHDFYLKMFQLSQPKLDCDVVLFDEGQDASGSILDIFLRQGCTKVIVGDTHQQIYAWRFAVNSLEKVHFKDFELTMSFRFGDAIAELASHTLGMKTKFLHDHVKHVPELFGCGGDSQTNTQAVISRTNIGLLTEAIRQVSSSSAKIYFEGNIYSYTYATEGTSLYDVLNLQQGKKNYIKDPLIKSMESFADLEDYVEKVDDAQMSSMIKIVLEFGSNLPNLIKKVKDLQTNDHEKHLAKVVFSTVHKSKGMEYDHVRITDDFLNYYKIKKILEKQTLDDNLAIKINEEINSLYVAITRAKKTITLSRDYVPPFMSLTREIQIT
jgi:F-box protein, helicase, 18